MSELIKADGLQKNYLAQSEQYLSLRAASNPEFKNKFIKTFSDLIFSQNDEMLEKLAQTKPTSLLNAVFKATEAGASFAKKEVSFIPHQIFKTTKKGDVTQKVATGEFEAVVIFDINFQKQQILKLKNCKRFFTAEIHEGVKVISDLMSGNYIFEGTNDVTKPTIGYYAAFITTEGEKYDLFMSNAEIIERAKFSPQFKADNYKKTSSSIHFEKIVVRNLMKEIPKISEELSSIVAYEESGLEFTPYEEVQSANLLEEKKKELAEVADEAPKPKKAAAKKEKAPEAEIKPNTEFDDTFF